VKEQELLLGAVERIFGAASYLTLWPEYMEQLVALAQQILLDLPNYAPREEEAPAEEETVSETVS